MEALKTLCLFVATAAAEIVGCYLPYLWLREGKSVWLLIPAALSLALFAWMLSLHPTAAGRVYAAYGGVYIGVAILWLWAVDGLMANVLEGHIREHLGSADLDPGTRSEDLDAVVSALRSYLK